MAVSSRFYEAVSSDLYACKAGNMVLAALIVLASEAMEATAPLTAKFLALLRASYDR